MNIQEFNFSVNLLQNILWQYNDAVNLQKLLGFKQTWYNENQTLFWTDWFNDIFNLLTANDFGCAVWSIILDIPLSIGPIPDPVDKPLFGFGSETDEPNTYTNFNNGNFATGGSAVQLTLEEKRLVLRLRYYQLTSSTAIPEVNSFFKYVFKDLGRVYLLDGLDMTIRAVFLFSPNAKLFEMIKIHDLIPHASGVQVRYIFVDSFIFGFGSETDEPNTYTNFNNGCFSTDEGLINADI